MITYEVKVYANGTKRWRIDGKLHREDGPAVEYADGTKRWYLNGNQLTEQEFNNRKGCSGKTVVIDGKTYELVLKQEGEMSDDFGHVYRG
jgi:hypothetical protein